MCLHYVLMQSGASPATSDFEQELADYLKALRLPVASAEKAQALCRLHDFSSARAHLIISRPGYHSGPSTCIINPRLGSLQSTCFFSSSPDLVECNHCILCVPVRSSYLQSLIEAAAASMIDEL